MGKEMPDNLENILNGITNELPPEPLVFRETNDLTPEQENTLNVIADEYAEIFASIAIVKQNFKPEELISESSLFDLLKEVSEKTQTLLIEVREVSATEVPDKMSELSRCIDALIEIEEKIVAAAKQYGYDASITVKQSDEDVEALSESSVAEAVPEISKETPSSRTSVEANENAAYISELAQMYKSGNRDIFRDPQSGNTKKLSVIFNEIQLIIAHEGLSVKSDIGRTFVRETGLIHDRIQDLNQEKKVVKSTEERLELNKKISSQYAALAESVISFLQTEKTNSEAVIENANQESNSEEYEDVDIRLSKAITGYEALLIEAGEKVDGSIAVSRIGQILDSLIDLQDHPETDINVAKNKKNKYLKTLRKEIENFKIEIAAGVTNTETVTEATEVPVEVTPVLKEVVPPIEEVPSSEGVVSEVKATEEKILTTYEVERGKWLEDKSNFREKQQEYRAALAGYYEEQKREQQGDGSWKAKLSSSVGGVKKLFGTNPELPPALQQMQNEYKELRAVYARSLDSVLTERAGLADNNAFSLSSDKTKMAFGRKFIAKPNQELLALQQGMLSPETSGRIKNIMASLSKYKWHGRVASVALAGTLGAVSGGVGLAAAGAAWQGWKIAASAFAGASAAKVAKASLQGRVDSATENMSATLSKFTLDDLNTLEAAFEDAQATKNSREKQQKFATIAAAIAVGGFTGYELGSISPASAGVVEGPSSPEEPTLADQSSSVPVGEPVQPGLSEEAMKRLVDSAADDGVEVGAMPITLTKITVPHYSINGDSLTYETNLSDIKLVGNFEANLLSDAQKTELNDFLKLKANDALSAHPSINESVLEAQLMEKLQGKFGNESWWNEAKLSKVDIGKMERVYFGGTATEAVPDTESLKGTYQVKSGDTLWKIVENKFAEDLKGVPAERRGEVMAKLFERIESNPELKASIGLKGVGGGDVDRIYAEQTINLDGIDKELDKLVEGDQIVESFRKSGPLPVDVDNATREIPITVAEREGIIDSFRNVVEKPIAGGVEVDLDQSNVYKEAAPAQMAEVIAKQEVIPAPRPFSASGSYFNHPDYQSYINKTFGSAKAFEQAVERAVTNFDNNTYDFFDRSLGNFESPYRFLGEKSLDELTKFEKLPNAEVRTFLAQNNMKYDTYLAWLDQVDKMKAALPTTGNTKVTDLFSRYVAETQIPKPNNLIK